MNDPRIALSQLLRVAELFALNGDIATADCLLDDVRHGGDAVYRALAIERHHALHRDLPRAS